MIAEAQLEKGPCFWIIAKDERERERERRVKIWVQRTQLRKGLKEKCLGERYVNKFFDFSLLAFMVSDW